jgi:hypothetical protein
LPVDITLTAMVDPGRVFNTDIAVFVGGSIASEATLVTRADVAGAIVTRPVVVAYAPAIEVPASVLNAVVALCVAGSVAA